MKKPILLIAFAIGVTFTGTLRAQVTIGSNAAPDGNAILDLKNMADPNASTKGLLLPRVALTATTNATPLTAHVAGMAVYNTATAGTAPNNVTPGYYYNDGTKWVRIADANAVSSSTEPWYNVATHTGATANTQNIYQMGKVGVGVEPESKFQVNDLGKTDGTKTTANIFSTLAVSGTSDYMPGLLVLSLTADADASNHTYLTGSHISAHHEGSGNVQDARGVSGAVLNKYAGTINTAFGMWPGITNQSTGTIADAKAVYATNYNNGGGSINQARGLETLIQNNGTGTITDAQGVYSTISNMSSGTITNGYGVYVDVITATNKWSVYATDATAPSYFAGKVGIGTNVLTSSPSVSVANAQLIVKSTNTDHGNGTLTLVKANNAFISIEPVSATDGAFNSMNRTGDARIIFNTTADGTYSSNDANPDHGLLIAPHSGLNGYGLYIGNNGNVGVGTKFPTNKLQVETTTDPLRLIGVQTTTTDTDVLTIDYNGTVHKKAISSLGGGGSGSSSGIATNGAVGYATAVTDANGTTGSAFTATTPDGRYSIRVWFNSTSPNVYATTPMVQIRNNTNADQQILIRHTRDDYSDDNDNTTLAVVEPFMSAFTIPSGVWGGNHRSQDGDAWLTNTNAKNTYLASNNNAYFNNILKRSYNHMTYSLMDKSSVNVSYKIEMNTITHSTADTYFDALKISIRIEQITTP